jgi:uncharacterized protein
LGREEIAFRSGDADCAGWLYRPDAAGDSLACVVLGHGFGALKEARLDAYAQRFRAAGHAVLAYRHFGASGGEPRQLLDVGRQHQDWHAAIAHARALDGVDPERIALRGSSYSGGHVIAIASADGRVPAAVAQAPHTDGLATLRAVGVADLVRLTAAGIRDLAGSLVGRWPYLIPTVGPPGTLVAINRPGAEPGYRALYPDGFEWRKEVSARAVLRVGTYSPGRRAEYVGCALLVQIVTEDAVTPTRPATRAAERAPRGELRSYPGEHFDIYVGELFERAVADQVDFLGRHL